MICEELSINFAGESSFCGGGNNLNGEFGVDPRCSQRNHASGHINGRDYHDYSDDFVSEAGALLKNFGRLKTRIAPMMMNAPANL